MHLKGRKSTEFLLQWFCLSSRGPAGGGFNLQKHGEQTAEHKQKKFRLGGEASAARSSCKHPPSNTHKHRASETSKPPAFSSKSRRLLYTDTPLNPPDPEKTPSMQRAGPTAAHPRPENAFTLRFTSNRSPLQETRG